MVKLVSYNTILAVLGYLGFGIRKFVYFKAVAFEFNSFAIEVRLPDRVVV